MVGPIWLQVVWRRKGGGLTGRWWLFGGGVRQPSAEIGHGRPQVRW